MNDPTIEESFRPLGPAWRVAYHEAGHAAVALALGVKVTLVEVDYQGKGRVKEGVDDGLPTGAFEGLVVAVAGKIAELHAVCKDIGDCYRAPRPFSRGEPEMSGDDMQVWCAAAGLTTRFSDKAVRRRVRSAEQTADAILRENWGWVDRLARLICEKADRVVTLTGEEVTAAVGRPQLPRRRARPDQGAG